MIEILSGILEACADVFPLQIRVVGEDLLFRRSCREHFQNIFDSDSHTANAWSAPALSGLDRNPRLKGCCCHDTVRPVGLASPLVCYVLQPSSKANDYDTFIRSFSIPGRDGESSGACEGPVCPTTTIRARHRQSSNASRGVGGVPKLKIRDEQQIDDRERVVGLHDDGDTSRRS